MKRIWNLVTDLLSRPAFVSAGIFGVSVFSLAAALTAEYAFGLLPCVLCVYQRVPFVITAILGAIAFALSFRQPGKAAVLIALSGAAFLANSLIAFYHTGVELHWWTSSIEGCSSPSLAGGTAEILARIEAAPVVYCDVIPWADPVFGLSMANYNAMMCLGLAIGCAFCFYLIRNKNRVHHEQAQRVGLSWKY